MRYKMSRWMLCTAALSAVLSMSVQAAQGNAETKAQGSSYYNIDGVLVQELKSTETERTQITEGTEEGAAEKSSAEDATSQTDTDADSSAAGGNTAGGGRSAAAAESAPSDPSLTAAANEAGAKLSPEEQAEQEKQAEEERLAKELFHLLNGQRVRAGKEAYQEEAALYEAAKLRAAEIADCSEEAVAANPRVIYDRPAAHPFAGTSQLLTSSITALDTAALPYYTAENGSLLVTELPVWRVYSTEAAMEQVLEKNKNFLMDQFSNDAGEEMQYGFNTMGVACELRGSAEYYSIFIGTRKNGIQ